MKLVVLTREAYMGATALGGPALVGGAGQVLGWIARGILVLISAFWLWFCIADGLGDAREFGVLGFIMMLPAAIVVLAALYVVWHWEYIGAWVLLGVALLGLWLALENAMQSRLPQDQVPGQFVIMLLLMSLPFAAAAVLLFIKHSLEAAGRGQGA